MKSSNTKSSIEYKALFKDFNVKNFGCIGSKLNTVAPNVLSIIGKTTTCKAADFMRHCALNNAKTAIEEVLGCIHHNLYHIDVYDSSLDSESLTSYLSAHFIVCKNENDKDFYEIEYSVELQFDEKEHFITNMKERVLDVANVHYPVRVYERSWTQQNFYDWKTNSGAGFDSFYGDFYTNGTKDESYEEYCPVLKAVCENIKSWTLVYDLDVAKCKENELDYQLNSDYLLSSGINAVNILTKHPDYSLLLSQINTALCEKEEQKLAVGNTNYVARYGTQTAYPLYPYDGIAILPVDSPYYESPKTKLQFLIRNRDSLDFFDYASSNEIAFLVHYIAVYISKPGTLVMIDDVSAQEAQRIVRTLPIDYQNRMLCLIAKS
jgi:hypothetical protein